MGLTHCRRSSKPNATRREIVERAESVLRGTLSSPVPISKLGRLVGRSERSLRDAFYIVHGMSPKRWVLAERLQEVRSALRGAGRRPATVTGIATDYGFYELGRFAAANKDAFGEAPSETLRGTSRRTADRQGTRHRSGDACS